MLIGILIFFTIGTSLGIAAGLVPGLHPNTVMFMLAALPAILITTDIYCLLALIVSMSVSNTIVNFIPSILLGAPDPGTALSVLPGHRYLLKGRGYDALVLTVAGGIMVTLFTALSLPLLLAVLPFLFSNLHAYTHILLLAVLFSLLLREPGSKKAHSAMVFVLSGIAGLILLSSLPSETVMFPGLSGLFGIPILLTSLSCTRIPPQKTGKMRRFNPLRGSIAGWLSGMLVGILPGIGSAQAGVLSGTILRGRESDFLVSLGGINTANIMFTFIMLHAASVTRSGAAVFIYDAVGSIGVAETIFVSIIALLSCFAASLSTLWIGKNAISRLHGLDYTRVNILMACFIFAMVFILGSFTGVFIAVCCAVIGISCRLLGVKMMYLMGFLMLPTIAHFSGLMPAILNFMA